jgi:DNA-directed RNA polymerase specialized sigma24 family protein
LGADLARAIASAAQSGKLQPWGVIILLLYYFAEWSFQEIADLLHVHEAVVRREHTKALRALKETGLLDGYD